MAATTFFPAGVWYEGGVGSFRNDLIPADPGAARDLFARNFADLASHGVNAAVVPNLSPSHQTALLDAARANRVRVILEIDREGGETGAMIRGSVPFDAGVLRAAFDRKLRPILGHPALWRVQLIDEPPPASFGRYAQVADVLRDYTGGKIGPFSCLIGANRFPDFLAQTRSDVAAFDFYPLGPNTPVGDSRTLAAWEGQCRTAADACRAAKADAYAVAQAHEIPGGLRFPTVEELRCLTYLALASGCQGVWWFLYQTEWMNRAAGTAMKGLVDMQYRGGANWAEVGRLARQIAGLAPTLTSLTPLPTPPAAWEASNSVTPSFWTDGRRGSSDSFYVFVVNRDCAKPLTMEMRLRPGPLGKVTVRRLPGEYALPVARRGRDLATAKENLLPGEGALYRVDGGAAA